MMSDENSEMQMVEAVFSRFLPVKCYFSFSFYFRALHTEMNSLPVTVYQLMFFCLVSTEEQQTPFDAIK